MKTNKKRIICIGIMVVMLFSTMGVGAFAESNQVENLGSVAEDDNQTEGASTFAEDNQAEGTRVTTQEVSVPSKLADVKGVKTLAGHQRVKLSWKKLMVEDGVEADRYVVKRSRNGGAFSTLCTVDSKKGTVSGKIKTVNVEANGYWIEDKDVGDGLIDYNGSWGRNGGTFTYKVIAEKDYQIVKYIEAPAEDVEEDTMESDVEVDAEGTNVDEKVVTTQEETVTVKSSGKTAVAAKGTCVRTSYVKLKLKTNKKLTSHGKKQITKKFSKGTTIYTCSFGIGQHMFIYKDHMFWLNRISTTSQKSGYTSKPIYAESAEYFVNSRPNRSSKTNKLIWISTYTQHMYLFTKVNGKWKCINGNGWKVSTGKAKTPTIRTIDPKSSVLDSGRKIGKQKSISKKLRSRHNIPYWSCFSSYNAIHGKKTKWTINATPKSGGCVRNTNNHAKEIYYNYKKGTGVIIF